MACIRKALYDTYDQPNVEILMRQRSEIEKIVDFGSRGRRKSSLSIRFPWHPLRKQVVSRKPLKLDIPGRKVLCSAFQDATSVKISTKSEHFYFWLIRCEILEFWNLRLQISSIEKFPRSPPIAMKFSQKLRFERLITKSFYREGLTLMVFEVPPVSWGRVMRIG